MKFVMKSKMNMTTNLLANTATLIVRIPGYIDIPPYQEKSRAKRSIIRTLIRSLQCKELELVYAGYWPEDALASASERHEGTLLSINVLSAGRAVTEFNNSQDTLVRRFRKELQSNSEQIVIDHPANGLAPRHIQVYLRSKFQEVALQQPRYAFAVSSGGYRSMTPSY